MENSEIIKKLNLRQKLALLTDLKSLSDAEINKAGVPPVTAATLLEINGDDPVYPAAIRLARSWDPDLFREVCRALAADAGARGIDLVITPDLKSSVSPYEPRLSEDPFLCGKLGESCLGGIRDAGVGSCLAGYSLTGADAEYLDVRENTAAIRQFYTHPFELAAKEGKPDALLSSLARLSGDYSDVNRRLVSGEMKGESFLICEDVPHDMDLHTLLSGNLLLGGAVLPLDSAVGKYARLTALIEEGSTMREELQEAVKRGVAIPESAIDEAVDRVITFARKIAEKKPVASPPSEQLRRRAAEESVVLLKNKEVLPLKPRTSVALIGAIAAEGEDSFARRFSRIARLDYDLEFAGQADGYALAQERSEELISEAVQLAESADVTLLFLGLGREREAAVPLVRNVALPANQLALVEALVRTKKKIVAVVVGDTPLDMSFDKQLHATMIASLDGALNYDILIDLLTGRRNPSGKLTNTCYDNTDELFLALKNYKDAGRNKVGPFLGYRRYDTAGTSPRYPFGHGLSYTTFAYSGMEVNETGIRFTLTNRGEVAGKEVVQIYAGKGGVRPKKELIAFRKVELKPGESTFVEIALPDELFTWFNEDTHSRETDGGTYTIYVGSSVSDIRLKGLYEVSGPGRSEKNERFADYLQCESNLMYGGYALKEARSRAIRNYREHRLIRLVALIVIAVTVACDLLLLAAQSAHLTSGSWYGGTMFTVNLILVFAGIALICERATRSKGATARLPQDISDLEGAESARSGALEKFFMKALEEKEAEEVPHEETGEEEGYFDEERTFARTVAELSRFTAERGLSLSQDSVRALLSSLASSRCIILRGSAKPMTALASALSEYFGTPFMMDAAEGYREPGDLFYKEGTHGVRVRSNLYRALVSASEMRPYLQLAVLTQVRAAALERYFSPIAAQLKDPRGRKLDTDETRGERYTIPPNLRFVLILAEGQSPAELPPIVAEVGCLLHPELTLSPPKEEKAITSPMGYRQLSELNRLAKLTCALDESLWKRIDKLELAAKARGSYRIDNRLWLMVENYTSVFLASGGTEEGALDSVIAAKLLAGLIGLWQNTEGEKLLPVLREIFDGDKIPRCTRVLKLIRSEGEKE